MPNLNFGFPSHSFWRLIWWARTTWNCFHGSCPYLAHSELAFAYLPSVNREPGTEVSLSVACLLAESHVQSRSSLYVIRFLIVKHMSILQQYASYEQTSFHGQVVYVTMQQFPVQKLVYFPVCHSVDRIYGCPLDQYCLLFPQSLLRPGREM
jgi:hypothetical protein